MHCIIKVKYNVISTAVPERNPVELKALKGVYLYTNTYEQLCLLLNYESFGSL